MKTLKDNFSVQSGTYARYRPVYPQALFDFLYTHVPAFDQAWDVATGNGQAAAVLAQRFAQVVATDISEQQMAQARQLPNIRYQAVRAENSGLPAHSFDLITVAQALHWFDFDAFYGEVKRVGRPGAVIAAWSYGNLQINTALDAVIGDFYNNTIGPYWDKERTYVDEGYKTIPFPFREIDTPVLTIDASWTRDQLIGYLSSWSSVQHYIKQHGVNPVDALLDKITPLWPGDQALAVSFPLAMRVGIMKE